MFSVLKALRKFKSQNTIHHEARIYPTKKSVVVQSF